MYYRLIEDDNILGCQGRVATADQYPGIHYTQKSKFEVRQDEDPWYAKITMNILNRSEDIYVADTREEYETIISRISDEMHLNTRQLKNAQNISNKTITTTNGSTLKIEFHESWQNQTKLYDTKPDSTSPGK